MPRNKPLAAQPPEPALRPTVVGIGASAGGLSALKRFFAAVPPDSGIAWVVVVHLASEHPSHLAELLQPHASMPIMQVTETVLLERDHVYVIPPDRNLSAVDSHLRLSPLEEKGSHRAPIDHFLRTLASSFDGHSVAVILTGTGSDGALGIRRIREKGGIVMIQDPDEAEFDGMPRAAMDTGVVDLVLSLEEIPRRIVDLARTNPQVRPDPGNSDRATNDEQDDVPRVLTQVRARTGQDFSRYKRSTLERRIERRMQLLGVEQLGAYLELLRDSAQEAAALAEDLLINVTSFFRDRSVFQYLENEVVPRLFEGKESGSRVRVWSVGCATGEEAYSLGILLLEEAARRERVPEIQIFASDLHERSLYHAREGLYPSTIEADVSAERLDRFFQRENGGYRVQRDLRERVVFAPHNLLRDPPFSHLDLVACRNLLIYLQRDVQDEVIGLFHYALRADGYLLLGTAETLERSEFFRTESKENHVFRRQNVARAEQRLPALPLSSSNAGTMPGFSIAPTTAARGAASRQNFVEAYGALHERMVERFAPPSLLVNQDHVVLHVSEHAGRFLRVSGVPSSNAFQLVREELQGELRALLHLARERHTVSRSRPIPMWLDGETRNVVMRVSPAGLEENEGFVLVIFDEVGDASTLYGGSQTEPHVTVRELEAELGMTRDRLQALVEEHETSQEEMRASNEELQSANEELRSTMEELETSKEELQSINEELQTVNQENRHKVEELSQLSSDLQNLFKATDVATLFLDRSFRILRFTPRVGEVFNIRSTDRGRPLADLTHRLGYGGLLEDAKRVLEALVPIEREVVSEDGQWHLVRLLPYRTVEDRIEGVVITLVDVTRLKQTEASLRASEERFLLFGDASSDVLWIRDAETLQWEYVSKAFESIYGVSREKALESGDLRTWAELIVPEDRQKALDAIARVRAGERLSFEFRIRRSDGKIRWIRNTDFPMTDANGHIHRIGGIGQDVTERKEIELRLRELNETLERRVEERTEQTREALRQLVNAEEEERRRISRELHDQMGQQLTGLLLTLSALGQGAESSESHERIAGLENLARSIASDMQSLAVELRPPALDNLGLARALEGLLHETGARHGIETDFHTSGLDGVRLPHETETTLYRVVQEGLTNALKHASPTRLSVVLEGRGNTFLAIVEDNGAGFDVDAVLSSPGMTRRLGLLGMRERVALFGGTLEIESEPGRGTTIFVNVHLGDSANGDETSME